MKLKEKSHLDILGAGPAGLGIGYFAKKNRISVSIYEMSNRVGGNCKTILSGDFRYDTGAHRLHDKHPKITFEIKKLLGNQLLKIEAPSKIYYRGSSIDFPLNIKSLLNNLDLVQIIKIGFEKLSNIIRANDEIFSFKELAYQNYGKTLSDLFLINYTEKLWGSDANELDPKISGDRLSNLDLKSLLKSLIMNNANQKNLDGSFLYPEYGFGTIFDKISENIGHKNIHLNSKVEKLIHDGNRIREIQCSGKKISTAGLVINTLPINVISKIFDPDPPDEVIESLKSLQYRHVKLCVIYLDIPSFTENASIYFPEPKFPFNRIYEPKNRSKKMAPINKTCIVVETSLGTDEISTFFSDKEYFNKIKKCLIEERFIKESNIIKYEVGFIQNAYPILNVGIHEKIEPAISYFSSFENHLLHGRNAQFKYVHTHDLLYSSKEFIHQIIE
ncbi:MAG: amine oxidase [Euryarchaeota archaeon]|nr:amine oxidase [Euryarchaeota archaeon]